MLSARVALLALSTLTAGGAASATRAEPVPAAAAEPGNWAAHKYTFNFMGFTTTYSCEGLEDKLRLLLQMTGAGPQQSDVHVVAPCNNNVGRPDKLAFAYLTFSSLQPATPPAMSSPPAAAGQPVGMWKHVEMSPRHPYQLGFGDCELIEQFRDTVLPLFSIRNVTNHVTCVPHQEAGSNFYLSFDVFAPSAPGKPPSKP